MVTRRLAKPRPVQGEAGSDDAARRGTGYTARADAQAAAQRDGHPRQNPAYRPATEKALVTGLFLSLPSAGCSDFADSGAGRSIWFEDERLDREVRADVDLRQEADHLASGRFFDRV